MFVFRNSTCQYFVTLSDARCKTYLHDIFRKILCDGWIWRKFVNWSSEDKLRNIVHSASACPMRCFFIHLLYLLH